MWRIDEEKAASKVLDKAPDELRKKWNVWLTVVERSGPDGLREIKGFHDEALKGQLQGYRSSRLSDRYRVIYEVDRAAEVVRVLDITRHEYRR